ncbi:maleate cis-trans isomerase family protein [Virgibacillus sp. W0181]|uniref:maleate cis-trans isomerase family protein n=1 Tax=Virgibacillus sp. W0181 TaxID=3391581 RepID=UPI003F462348
MAVTKNNLIRTRIGFLAIANAGIIENDMFSMKPDGVFLHFTRIPMGTEVSIKNLSGMEKSIGSSVDTLMPGREELSVICYNCTSGSFVIGEEKVINKIEEKRPEVKGTTMISGVVNALHTLNVRRIAVGTAYTNDINELESKFLKDKGFDVLHIKGLNLKTDVEMNNVSPEELVDFAISLDHPEAEAIFLSCGALRSTEVVATIEEKVNKPVITSNQASFWNCLRLAGIEDNVKGFGKLFEH